MASISTQSNRKAQQKAKATKKALPKEESESDVSDRDDEGLETEMSGNEIKLISFGARYGPPKMADLVISVAHFENPPRELRAKMDGLSSRLQSEFYGHPTFPSNYEKVLSEVLDFIAKNGNKRTLTIAVGCEEGKHRSVAVIEKLLIDLKTEIDEGKWEEMTTYHRDIDHKQKKITQQKQYDKRRQEKRGQQFQDEDY
jgi:RNase adaptor protein for sRNA GlmZ degradation